MLHSSVQCTTAAFCLLNLTLGLVLLLWYEPLENHLELEALSIDEIPEQPVQVAIVGSLVKGEILAVLEEKIELIGHVLSD